MDEYIPDFDDGEDMLEIDEEENVVEVQSRQASLGKENPIQQVQLVRYINGKHHVLR